MVHIEVFTFLMFGIGSLCSWHWHEFIFWLTGKVFLRLSHLPSDDGSKETFHCFGVLKPTVWRGLTSWMTLQFMRLYQTPFGPGLIYMLIILHNTEEWQVLFGHGKVLKLDAIQAQGGLLASHTFLPLILIQKTMKGSLRPHLHAHPLKVIIYGFTILADSPSPLTPSAIHLTPLLSVRIVRQPRAPHK